MGARERAPRDRRRGPLTRRVDERAAVTRALPVRGARARRGAVACATRLLGGGGGGGGVGGGGDLVEMGSVLTEAVWGWSIFTLVLLVGSRSFLATPVHDCLGER